MNEIDKPVHKLGAHVADLHQAISQIQTPGELEPYLLLLFNLSDEHKN